MGDNDGKSIKFKFVETGKNEGWKQYHSTFTSVSNVVDGRFYLILSQVNGSVWIDDVYVGKGKGFHGKDNIY